MFFWADNFFSINSFLINQQCKGQNSISRKTKGTTKTTKLQKKQYEQFKKRALIRKQNESNREIKQNEGKQKREKIKDEDINFGRFFDLETPVNFFVNSLNLHEIKNETLLG